MLACADLRFIDPDHVIHSISGNRSGITSSNTPIHQGDGKIIFSPHAQKEYPVPVLRQ